MNALHRTLFRLRHWWRARRYPPAVVISRGGQLTLRPQVHVSVESTRGSQGVYTWADDDQGNACAEMYAQGLGHICGLRLIDRRRDDERQRR